MPINVNTNYASLSAQRNLSQSQGALSKTMERLSSGLQVNSAKDDAAGLAISARLSTNLNGMNQAVRNANDGISMAMTAEGSLGKIVDNLQRMRQLAVQSANGNYTSEDRASLQGEAQQLSKEIKRMAGSSNFSGINLLDGTLQRTFQTGDNTAIHLAIGDMSASALGSNDLATGGSISQAVAGTANAVSAQTLTITGSQESAQVAVGAGDSAKTIAENINAVLPQTGVSATARTTATISNVSAGKVEFTLRGANKEAETISADVSDPNRLEEIAMAINAKSGTTNITAQFDDKGNLTLTESKGNDIRIGNATTGGGLATATVRGGDRFDQKTGERLGSGTATGPVGDGSPRAPQTITVGGSVNLSSASSFSLSTDSAGSLLASQSQQSRLSSIANLDLTTVEGSGKAVKSIDAAMDTLGKTRADLGSINNRLEAGMFNTMDVSDNLAAARGRIRDADFAAETVSLTRSQILQQAGTAMLTQANSLPQQVLSLLRG